MTNLAGLAQINVELTSRCDKACFFCGHQNPKINHAMRHGDMDLPLLAHLAQEIPRGVTVQFHRDGEPLVYPELEGALNLFRFHQTSLVTNGKKLGDLADVILRDPPTSICVSMFRGDPDGAAQLTQLGMFLSRLPLPPHAPRLPLVVVKVVGDPLDAQREEMLAAWEECGLILRTTRPLHVPQGSHHYRKRQPTIPETGVCLDLLHHPSIDWTGGMYLCNRLDPEQRHFLGRIPPFSLEELWNGERRRKFLAAHRARARATVEPCASCEFWGVPTP